MKELAITLSVAAFLGAIGLDIFVSVENVTGNNPLVWAAAFASASFIAALISWGLSVEIAKESAAGVVTEEKSEQ